ncbi:MAG: glutamate 5-kinase [Eubacteriales bacterium]|jgi:glutamate 5-kinase|nr:glutamate 5-kinase [Lachnospiraceae bacterium]MDD5859084.1 glutamate 5-kinase [Eubacteriales bacterium]MCH4064630.1 glutamate 5-kinase [Lachnospiraceae bacterium]MCH4104861.1 glutamate 5-kinase [Lachnospiraceae bacterium]MCI1309754.1 glutamate 5-kinase [Lachnospiraceae bacterium]
MNIRERLKDKQRIVIKIGSSSLVHAQTGRLNLPKIEILAREVADLRNQGKDVTLVSSGAIAVGRAAMKLDTLHTLKQKQACAAIGQVKLMMIYQKFFSEYGQTAAQLLLTKATLMDPESRVNSMNTFEELFALGVIPVVNENDSVETYEIRFGDNDRLSAIVTALIHADLLILLSDIDGLYTDDPKKNPKAEFIPEVDVMDDHFRKMGKDSTGSDFGTGGMATKLAAADIATSSGADMIIADASDFRILHRLIDGERIGTIFRAHPREMYLMDYLEKM